MAISGVSANAVYPLPIFLIWSFLYSIWCKNMKLIMNLHQVEGLLCIHIMLSFHDYHEDPSRVTFLFYWIGIRTFENLEALWVALYWSVSVTENTFLLFSALCCFVYVACKKSSNENMLGRYSYSGKFYHYLVYAEINLLIHHKTVFLSSAQFYNV